MLSGSLVSTRNTFKIILDRIKKAGEFTLSIIHSAYLQVLIRLARKNPLKVAMEKLPETCPDTCRNLSAKCLLQGWKSISLFSVVMAFYALPQ